jgi:nucleoid-associated protein YgaU
MLGQSAVVWAGATGAAIAAVGAAALYVAHPSFVWPASAPSMVKADAPPSAASPRPSSLPAQSPSAAASAAAGAQAAPANAAKPAFDVVNVAPTGEAVIAGRAAPNVTVELRDDGKTLADAKTDGAGQFVIIPPALAPGAHSLTLTTGPDPSPSETSNAIAVAVPEPPSNSVVAALTASKPMPAPSSPMAAAAPLSTASEAPGSDRIVVQSIETSPGGRLVARGVAEPNATVRLYLSGAFVGDAKTKADGRWSLTISRGMTQGSYALRADEINPANAAVIARAEAPFDFPAASAAPAAPERVVGSNDDNAAASVRSPSPADVVVDSVQTHHVERGHTLWGISQKYYGDGSRYRMIFAANTSQIRNPNLIYPGQTFVVPKPEPNP